MIRWITGVPLLVACGARTDLPFDRADLPAARDASVSCGAPVPATIQVTSDDQFRLFVDGKLVDDVARRWWDVQTYSIVLHGSPSQRNTIAVEGTNVWSQDGVDRGILADIRFVSSAGEQHVVTSASWRVSTVLVAGWELPTLDDAAWQHATSEGKNGILPYKQLLATTDAEWLWSYDANKAASKPTAETVWVRRDFYIVEGRSRDFPGSCP